MNDEIKQLIGLQEIDKSVDCYLADLDMLPRELESFEQQITEIKQKFESVKKKIVEHQLKKKEKEVELGSCEEKIRKSEMELNTIKSNDSYKIKLNEIEQNKNLKSSIEDEILILMDEIDHFTSELKTKEQESRIIENEIQDKKKIKESEIQKIQSLYEEQLKIRETYCKTINAQLLSSYESIRTKKKGNVLACIVGESCGGCNTMITPGTINEVRKNKTLVHCDSCSMILYLEEVLKIA